MSEINFNKIKDEYKDVAPPGFDNEIDEIDEIVEFENYNIDEEDDNINEYSPEEEVEEIEDQQEIDGEKNKKQNDDEQEEDGDDEDYEQEDNNGDDLDEEDILNNAKSNTLGGAQKRKEIPLITDYNKKINISQCKERITRPILTKYEKTLILGHRAQQILNNSHILVNIEKLKDKSPLEIARKELKEGLIPFIIRRPLPNGRFEDWKCSELIDIS
tara:strand:+ start:240 stop:887 length:648 start_codon:yes stop_codon:yes gene_type:complete